MFCNAAAAAAALQSFVDHSMAIPKADVDELEAEERLNMQPRDDNF